MNRVADLVVGMFFASFLVSACAEGDRRGDPLVGRYQGFTMSVRAWRADYELQLEADSRAYLRVDLGGAVSEERGSWTRRGRFIVLELHPVASDALQLERAGLSVEDFEQTCRAHVAVPTADGLLLFDEILRPCGEVGDPQEIVRLSIGPPVRLTR